MTNTSASPFDDATPTRTAAKAGVAARLPGKRQDTRLPAAAVRSARRALGRSLAIAVLASVLFTPAFAADGNKERPDSPASSTGDVAEKQGNLKSLRTQIEALRREMVAAEGSRKESADQLKDAERAISSTQRDLHQLKEQIATLQGKLKDLDGQAKALEQGLTLQQQQLEKLLYRQYLRGNPDALQLFLNGDDPHQLARDLHYLEAIGRARSQLLLEIETNLQRQKALAVDAREQAAQLAAAEDKQREEHAKLLAQRAQRQATLDGLSEQITTQRREIGKLQRDEARLTNLVERLSRIIAAKAAEARREAERQASERQAAAQRERALAQQEIARQEAQRTARQHKPAPPDAGAGRAQPESEPPRPEIRREAPPAAPPAARQEAPRATPPAEAFVGNLAKMKGSLRLPTKGSVSNRFGSARQEGSTWKGLFIRAGTGSDVHSIAAGRVVFAEWMRGFGNLLIVDHGSDYLSVYANNDSLLKQVGDDVRGGESIATVGNTGGNPESGLYFEIRHDGKPLDPLAWVNSK
ncbi:peptidoglycan DD-metalloendopeptidase family protein [Candidatus Accumulibacter sp. ACC007]|uniref:murein hydrolase activator EnvC family protein n=1 Tax=Candidatus Accumulibacter sp. ACC007 TaxID=2823333 RepID=UPI0025C37BFB|nr:peptidoglycan DD-metalloendopeptidase family protein [Candidatus Accumulibacter sp. ACC007]